MRMLTIILVTIAAACTSIEREPGPTLVVENRNWHQATIRDARGVIGRVKTGEKREFRVQHTSGSEVALTARLLVTGEATAIVIRETLGPGDVVRWRLERSLLFSHYWIESKP